MKRSNTTGLGPVIPLFESELPFNDVKDFLSLVRIRNYIDQVLDDMWYGRIKKYPKDFEKVCAKDEKMTECMFEKYGRRMGVIITYLKGD